MTTSPSGRAMIEQFEGLRLNAYKDQRGIPTIGYGHTSGVQMGDVITQAEADGFLIADLRMAEAAVNHLVSVMLSQNQFDALVSLVYNIGQGNFASSEVRKMLNAGNYEGAIHQLAYMDGEENWHGWVFTNGVVNPGLVRRRLAEQKLFGEAA